MKPIEKRVILATVFWVVYVVVLSVFTMTVGTARDLPLAVSLTVAVALVLAMWVLWSRWGTTLALIGALCFLPFESRAQTAPPPDKDSFVMIFCGLVVLTGGIIAIIMLKKLCNKLPPIDPPQTNAPPVVPAPPWTNITLLPVRAPVVTLTDDSVTYRRCDPAMLPDTNGVLVSPWLLSADAQFETSPNLRDWKPVLSFRSWFSAVGAEFVWSTSGVPFLTNYVSANFTGWSNVVPFPLLSGPEQSQFVRLKNP